MKAKRCLVAFVAMVLGLSVITHDEVVAAEKVTITGATLNEFGLYRRQAGKFNTWPWEPKQPPGSFQQAYLIKSTDVIDATVDTTFGIVFTVEGSPAKTEVDCVVEITHPEVIDPKTKKASTSGTLKLRPSIGKPTYTDVNLDTPASVVGGEWTFRILYNSKILLEKSFKVNPAAQVSEANAQRVDDVPVFGWVSAVSAEDIHQGINEATDKTFPDAWKKPQALEVLSPSTMRAYLPKREMGFIQLILMPTVETDGRQHVGWTTFSFAVADTPNALSLIRTADDVYIFPLKNPSESHRDDAHTRLLGPQARKALVRVLGHKNAWFHGGYTLASVGPEPPNVGLVFRKKHEEVVLFFTSGPIAEGTVNGANTKGLLNGADQFEGWKRRYARPELAAK